MTSTAADVQMVSPVEAGLSGDTNPVNDESGENNVEVDADPLSQIAELQKRIEKQEQRVESIDRRLRLGSYKLRGFTPKEKGETAQQIVLSFFRDILGLSDETLSKGTVIYAKCNGRDSRKEPIFLVEIDAAMIDLVVPRISGYNNPLYQHNVANKAHVSFMPDRTMEDQAEHNLFDQVFKDLKKKFKDAEPPVFLNRSPENKKICVGDRSKGAKYMPFREVAGKYNIPLRLRTKLAPTGPQKRGLGGEQSTSDDQNGAPASKQVRGDK